MTRPADTEIAQAGDLVAEVVAVAHRVDQLCYHFYPQDDNVAQYQLQLDMLRDQVQRIGWLADLCAQKLGHGAIRGDAEEWMTSPLYLNLKRSSE